MDGGAVMKRHAQLSGADLRLDFERMTATRPSALALSALAPLPAGKREKGALYRIDLARTGRTDPSAIKREVCHTILGNSFGTDDVAERRTKARAAMLAIRTISRAHVAVHTRQAHLA